MRSSSRWPVISRGSPEDRKIFTYLVHQLLTIQVDISLVFAMKFYLTCETNLQPSSLLLLWLWAPTHTHSSISICLVPIALDPTTRSYSPLMVLLDSAKAKMALSGGRLALGGTLSRACTSNTKAALLLD